MTLFDAQDFLISKEREILARLSPKQKEARNKKIKKQMALAELQYMNRFNKPLL
jgi:hypothetical protein